MTTAGGFGHFQVHQLALQGAVGGLFFAQTVAWQELVDAIIVHVAGPVADHPWAALGRAVAITLFTTASAYVLVRVARGCACVRPVVRLVGAESGSDKGTLQTTTR